MTPLEKASKELADLVGEVVLEAAELAKGPEWAIRLADARDAVYAALKEGGSHE